MTKTITCKNCKGSGWNYEGSIKCPVCHGIGVENRLKVKKLPKALADNFNFVEGTNILKSKTTSASTKPKITEG